MELLTYLLIILSFIILFILFYYLWFLRKPNITFSKDNNTIISPADGRIVRIIEFDRENVKINKGYLGRILAKTKDTAKEGYIICISLNPFNIHYQIAPVNGAVEKITCTKGRLRNVMRKPYLLRFMENEMNEILIKAKKTKVKNNLVRVKIIQIAGIFARRIHCFAKKRQNLNKGELIGLIKLGSMVVLITPRIKLVCREGQRIKLAHLIGHFI